MALPTASQVISPLIAWARIHGKRNKDIVRDGSDDSQPGIQRHRYRLLMKAEGQQGDWNDDVGLKWREIPGIMEACGFDNIDMLIHVAQADEMVNLHIPASEFKASIYTPERRHVGAGDDMDLEPQPASENGKQEAKTSEQLAKESGNAYRMRLPLGWKPSGGQDLYGHRTIVEKVVLPTGESTRMDYHLGCESILVIAGTVEFQFDGRSRTLNEGDFFSFNSQQSHLAISKGEEDAVLAVARLMCSEKMQADLSACDNQYKNASKYFMETRTRTQIRNLIDRTEHHKDAKDQE